MRAACRPTNRGTCKVTGGFCEKPPGNGLWGVFMAADPSKCRERRIRGVLGGKGSRERNRFGASGVHRFTRLCSRWPMSELERSLLRRLQDRDERAFRELI